VKPALHAEPAYTGGTAITKGERGYRSRPPDAPVDVKIRAMFGAAISDSL
jgi:hypothetical protein